MPTLPLPGSVLIAYHGTAGGDNLTLLFAFFGATATIAWLLLSRLRWRNTVMIAAGAWLAGVALTFIT